MFSSRQMNGMLGRRALPLVGPSSVTTVRTGLDIIAAAITNGSAMFRPAATSAGYAPVIAATLSCIASIKR